MNQSSIYKIPLNPNFLATHKPYNTSTLPHHYDNRANGFHDNKPPNVIRPKPVYPTKLSPLPTTPSNGDSTSSGSLSNNTPSFGRGSSLGHASDTNSFHGCGPSPDNEDPKVPESENVCCGCQAPINSEPGALSLPSCGHFVCGSCVEKMVEGSVFAGYHDNGGGNEKLTVLNCPACNLPFSLDLHRHRGYKSNYDVTSAEFEKSLDLNADNN